MNKKESGMLGFSRYVFPDIMGMNRLRKARFFIFGVTQKKLGELTGVGSTICAIENGLNPSNEMKRKIAKSLRLDIDWLFPDDPSIAKSEGMKGLFKELKKMGLDPYYQIEKSCFLWKIKEKRTVAKSDLRKNKLAFKGVERMIQELEREGLIRIKKHKRGKKFIEVL